MYRVAHAGQMGYHQRVDYNKWVVRISEKADDINPKGGFKHYGVVKNSYIIVKGSIPGPSKRLICFMTSIRPNKHIPANAPSIEYLALATHQGTSRREE